MRFLRRSATAAAAACLVAGGVRAQAAPVAKRLAAMTAVTGFEQAVADSVRALVPGARRDRAGDVVRTWGTGPGGLLVACPLDEAGYVVGRIRDDGWLTLRRVGAPPIADFDRALEGQRVAVWSSRGPLAGVVAVRSVHLTRDRAAANAPFTVDDALVDVGAASGAAARAGGIAVLAPVAREKQPISYGDGRLAAPWAGRRSACAALAVAAAGSRPTGRVVVAFVVEDRLGARGLRTVLNLFGPFDRSVLLDGVAGELGGLVAAGDPVAQRRLPALGVASHLSLPVRYPGTPVETVSLGDVERLADSLGATMGGAR